MMSPKFDKILHSVPFYQTKMVAISNTWYQKIGFCGKEGVVTLQSDLKTVLCLLAHTLLLTTGLTD